MNLNSIFSAYETPALMVEVEASEEWVGYATVISDPLTSIHIYFSLVVPDGFGKNTWGLYTNIYVGLGPEGTMLAVGLLHDSDMAYPLHVALTDELTQDLHTAFSEGDMEDALSILSKTSSLKVRFATREEVENVTNSEGLYPEDIRLLKSIEIVD